MVDNTGNNDTTCDNIESILTRHGILTFDTGQHQLPCLAHVINLAITSVMSQVMKIANIETSTVIWEFDPNLLSNCLQGNTLDVVSAIQMLTIKIQASNQCISYFECPQVECRIDKPLKILLHSNVWWGTAYGMLEQSYQLHQVGCNFHIVKLLITHVSFHLQAINLFICLANELFGPITTT